MPETDESRNNRHELYRRIDTMDSMIKEMHSALVGDKYGNRGFGGRIEKIEESVEGLEKKVSHHHRIFWFISVAGTSIWALIVTFKEELVTVFRR